MTIPANMGHATSQIEPKVCAITGRPVIGLHAVTFYLHDGYYYRVLNQAVHQRSPEFHEAMRKALADHLAPAKPKTTKEKE